MKARQRSGLRFLARLSAVTAVVAGLSLLPGAPAMGEPAQLHKTSGLGQKCRLLHVDSVDFMDGGRRGGYLYIGGLRQYANMNVGLDHYAQRGDTLTVEVVGCTPNAAALPVPTPFNIELPLRDIPRARKVRIVGENGASVYRLPGR